MTRRRGGGDDSDCDNDGSGGKSDLAAHISLVSQRQILGRLRHTGDAAVEAAQVTLKVLGGDARQVNHALLTLQTAVDLNAVLGIRVGGPGDRGRALHALHRRGAGTAHVAESAAVCGCRMMMRQLGGRTTHWMALNWRLIVRRGAPRRLLRPQQLDLHLINDVVEAVQVGVRQGVLHRAAALALHADRVARVTHGQVQQAAGHQDGVLHLAHGAHELLHAVQNAGVAELRLVVPGDPP